MDEWRNVRVTGEALKRLAGLAAVGATSADRPEEGAK
jgi:hypothetical protein